MREPRVPTTQPQSGALESTPLSSAPPLGYFLGSVRRETSRCPVKRVAIYTRPVPGGYRVPTPAVLGQTSGGRRLGKRSPDPHASRCGHARNGDRQIYIP